MNTNKYYKGSCTMCGKKNRNLFIVDEDNHVCQDCLDNEFIYCDECREYWLWDALVFYHMKDGRTICENCIEDFDEDDIEDVTDYTC